MRTCTKCGNDRDDSFFYKRKNGLSYMCKDCYSIWRENNYNKHKESMIEQRSKNKGSLRFRYQYLRSTAKSRNIQFELTIEQYSELISKPCFYCQNKLGIKVTNGGGIDRLDSQKSYSIENSVSCCGFCNPIKNDLLSPDEMLKVAELLIKERDGKNPIDIHQLRLKSKRGKIQDLIKDEPLLENNCVDCGKIITALAKRCRSCAHKKSNI